MTIKSIEKELRSYHVVLCRAHRGIYHLYRDAVLLGFLYSHLSTESYVRFYLDYPYFCGHTVYKTKELREYLSKKL